MADDDSIAYGSATSLTKLYRTRELSPVEATEQLFRRIEALQPKLNAFCIFDREGAVAMARASEARWRRGEPLGPLDGVPVTIKDLMLMRGFPTLRGSHLVDRGQDWSEDTPAVARLREAGAVILGKTTTSEFGWKALGDSPLTGITRNPWDLSRTPGGSSAGAAAAAAAGIGVLHLGSDGAGSIRTPSSFCGLFGLKAELWPGPGLPSFPARAVVASRPDRAQCRRCGGDVDRDLASRPPRPLWSAAPKTAIGIPGSRAASKDGASRSARISAMRGSTRKSAQCGGSGGTAIRGPWAPRSRRSARIFDSPRDALFTLWASGLAALFRTVPAEQRALADPGLLETVAAGERITAADWVQADLVRNALGRRMGAFHQKYDLLLTPTMPIPALPVGQDLNDPARERHWIDWSPFSYPFNMTRQPAASICCGLTSQGLPIGLQIVGPLYGDDRVLRAARAFEATQPVRRPPPLT